MSLRPEKLPEIPEETARIVRSLFPTGKRSLWFRDELGAMKLVVPSPHMLAKMVSHLRLA